MPILKSRTQRMLAYPSQKLRGISVAGSSGYPHSLQRNALAFLVPEPTGSRCFRTIVCPDMLPIAGLKGFLPEYKRLFSHHDGIVGVCPPGFSGRF